MNRPLPQGDCRAAESQVWAGHPDLEVPAGMRRVSRRFERWRKGHQARLPIPEALWAAAAEAAREHGVFCAAKALHLEYAKLKRMTQGQE